MTNCLRKIRLRKKEAIWGLAVKSGVNPSLLSAIEKHGYTPSLPVKSRIAKALDVEVADIWPEECKEVKSYEN